MVIEPIIGIQKDANIISEKEFDSFSILSTAEMLREYFLQYGYQFIGFFCDDKDTIVVKDNNLDVSIMTGDVDVYRALDYKNNTIMQNRLTVSDALIHSFSRSQKQPCFTHSIEKTEHGMRLVQNSTSTIILEAEVLQILDSDKVLVRNFGLESIYSLSEGINYPLMKTEPTIYSGKHPEEFVDMRFGMYVTFQHKIQMMPAFRFSLLEIVEKYPYGEKLGNHFHLMSYPIRHGIFYKNLEVTYTQWYSSREEREKVLKELGGIVEGTLKKTYVRGKKD